MSTETSPELKKPEIDPFAKDLADSIGMVLEPEEEAKPSTAIGGAETELRPTVTLGEAVVEVARVNKAKTPEELEKEEEEQAAAKEAEEKAAKEKADKEKNEKDKGTQTPPPPSPPPPKRPVVKKLAEPPSLPELPPAPVVSLAQVDEGDEAYIGSLEPDQQTVIELARYAEAHGKKGILRQTIDHFKAVDKFIDEHPDVEADSEEFANAVAQTQPKWSESERRRIERQMISDQAAEAARRTLDPVIQEQNRQLRQMSNQPFIEQGVTEMTSAMTAKQEGELEAVDPDIIKAIKTEGYETAVRKHRVEAPIVKASMDAAQAWLEVRRGIRKLDTQNDADAWLVSFINTQGAIMASRPKEEQIISGKQFLPMNQYAAEARKDQNVARAKYWTFSDEMILDMIANHTVLRINEEYKIMAESGFERKKKNSPANGNPPANNIPTPTPASGSPRAGGRALPGAADLDSTSTDDLERDKFMDTLVPGISKELKKK